MPLLVDHEITGSGRKRYILKDLNDDELVWSKTFTTPEGLARAIVNYLKGGRAIANVPRK
jgi:hypothetical protein